MKVQLSSVILLVPVCLWLASCERGCGCSGEDPGLLFEGQSMSLSQVSSEYAQHLPLGTQGLLVVGSFADVSSSIQAVKARIQPIFDLGAVEEEVRNTFGVDIHRPVTFREIGVSYNTGFALSYLHEQPVLLFFVSNQESLSEHVRVVLRRQPFNLRAPVVIEQLGEFEVQLFSRRAADPPEVALMSNGRLGIIISRSNRAMALLDVARMVAETSPETSISSNPQFDLQLTRLEGFPGLLFVDTVATTAALQERMAGQLNTLQTFVLDEFKSSVLSFGAAIRIEPQRLSLQSYLSVSQTVADLAANIDNPSDLNPRLERFLHPSTLFGVRVGIHLPVFWSTVLHFQGEQGARNLRRRVAPLEELLETRIEEMLGEVLTGQLLLTINRLSLLNLVQARNFNDAAEALELVIVAQLANRERAIAILDGLVARDVSYQRLDDGPLVRFTCSNRATCFGNLMVVENSLIMAPDRVRRSVVEMARTEVASDDEQRSRAIRELLAAPSGNGFFIDLSPQIVGLTTLLNYPQAVRQLLGMVDNLVVQFETADNGLLVNGHLVLTALE